MKEALLDALSILSILTFITCILIAIVHLFKKDWKTVKNSLIFVAISFVTLVIAILNTDIPEEPTEVAAEEIVIAYEESIFLTIDSMTYDAKTDIVTIEATTNVVDGTNIGLHIEEVEYGEMYGNNADVQAGKVTIQVGDYEFIKNGTYTVHPSIAVDEVNNLEFPTRYGTYSEVLQKVEIVDGAASSIEAEELDYDIDFTPAEQLTITEAHSAEQVADKELERDIQQMNEKKKTAIQLRFAELNKNPDKHAGEFVTYQGEILQIMEDETSSDIRLAVTKDSYGYSYDDVVYVTYEGTTPFVDEDIITIYGTVEGAYTYESTAGYQITLPHIEAEIIE